MYFEVITLASKDKYERTYFFSKVQPNADNSWVNRMCKRTFREINSGFKAKNAKSNNRLSNISTLCVDSMKDKENSLALFFLNKHKIAQNKLVLVID